MKYDFDLINNRRGTHSLKWDVAENELPMWVADMDFQTAPAVTEAMINRAKQGIFGYHIVPSVWYDAITDWWKKRHKFSIEKEWLIFCTGVIPAISCAVKRITNIGDNVVVQTPVYDIFFHSIENHGRHVLENKLLYDGKKFELDFTDLEEKLSHPQTTMMILCNPQNPTGKVWTKEELTRIGKLCEKYHVVVLADEIHCDITDPGVSYIPYASVSDCCRRNSITCLSATKAFNIAGLQTAAVSIPSETLRNKMERGLNSDEVAEPNAFAIDAVIAAFCQGEEWLDELRDYIHGNRILVEQYLEENISDVHLIASQATYLLWIDCAKITKDTDELCGFIRRQTGLFLTAGGQYRGDSETFIRMNIACPRQQVLQGLHMLQDGIQQYKEQGLGKC